MYSNVDCNHKILIVGKETPNVEIFSLETDVPCLISDGGIGFRYGAVDGFVNGLPTICGGYHSQDDTITDSCYQYKSGQNAFVQFAKMKTGVFWSGFAQWNNKIIITGGRSFDIAIPQVQVVDEATTWSLPDMPVNIMGHCMMETVSNTYILIGGVNENNSLYNETFFITPSNDSKIFQYPR